MRELRGSYFLLVIVLMDRTLWANAECRLVLAGAPKIFPIAKIKIARTTIWVNHLLIEKVAPSGLGVVSAGGEIGN